MKRFALIVTLSLAAGAGGVLHAAEGKPSGRAVLAPAKRFEALKIAGQVLAPRTPTWKTVTSKLPDPFFRSNFAREEEKVAEVPKNVRPDRSDHEVLEAAASNHINPTGTMMVDGENYLLLGGRRYKTGAALPVTLDGIVYTIVISAIEGKSYTLRLNEQELRRQLK